MFAMAADQSERVLSIGGLVAARLNGSPGFRLTLDRLDLASRQVVLVRVDVDVVLVGLRALFGRVVGADGLKR